MSSTSEVSALPFDEVFLEIEGRWKKVSVTDFFELPLSVRVQHVIQRTVTFRAKGELVDQREALAAIRRYRAATAIEP